MFGRQTIGGDRRLGYGASTFERHSLEFRCWATHDLADGFQHITYELCTRVFTVWVVFPPHLFVLPSLLVQLMATHFVSCPLEPILRSTPSIVVPLLTGMSSQQQ